MGTTTRTEYKVINGVFKKRKVQLCVMGNQQEKGVHYQREELYAPVMKAAKVRLFMAIEAKYWLNLFKSHTKQASLTEISAMKRVLFGHQIDGWSMTRLGALCS